MPYGCSDGSCVADPSLCNSCPYFCAVLGRCVGSKYDCDVYKDNTNLSELEYTCPPGAPHLCILNGRCEQSASLCPHQNTVRTEKGLLFDDNCPSDSPIRCINGDCVQKYQSCIDSDYFDSTAYHSPIAWKLNKPVSEASLDTCQVVCTDGSCRDR